MVRVARRDHDPLHLFGQDVPQCGERAAMTSAQIDTLRGAVLLEIGGNQHSARAERGSGLAEAGEEGIEAKAVVQGGCHSRAHRPAFRATSWR